jgi:hypothetical protein
VLLIPRNNFVVGFKATQAVLHGTAPTTLSAQARQAIADLLDEARMYVLNR